MTEPSGELWRCQECGYETRIYRTDESHSCPECPPVTKEVVYLNKPNETEVIARQALRPMSDEH